MFSQKLHGATFDVIHLYPEHGGIKLPFVLFTKKNMNDATFSEIEANIQTTYTT